MGDDVLSGKNFDHRKTWIEEWLRQFAAVFGIDLINGTPGTSMERRGHRHSIFPTPREGGRNIDFYAS
jgi:hypothetical protein